jgi:hypothetical protein
VFIVKGKVNKAWNRTKKDELTSVKVTGGAGSGISHKTSRKANNKEKVEKVEEEDNHHVLVVNDNPYFVFDAGCDVGASIESLATL